MDTETLKYRITKLPEDLKRMVEKYSETVNDAKRMEPSFVPLHLLVRLDDVTDAVTVLENLIEVAIENIDADERAIAILKGVQELNKRQAERIWKLTGLVLQQMQLTQPEKLTHALGEMQ